MKVLRQDGEVPVRRVCGWFWKLRREAQAGHADLQVVGAQAVPRPARVSSGMGVAP